MTKDERTSSEVDVVATVPLSQMSSIRLRLSSPISLCISLFISLTCSRNSKLIIVSPSIAHVFPRTHTRQGWREEAAHLRWRGQPERCCCRSACRSRLDCAFRERPRRARPEVATGLTERRWSRRKQYCDCTSHPHCHTRTAACGYILACRIGWCTCCVWAHPHMSDRMGCHHIKTVRLRLVLCRGPRRCRLQKS